MSHFRDRYSKNTSGTDQQNLIAGLTISICIHIAIFIPNKYYEINNFSPLYIQNVYIQPFTKSTKPGKDNFSENKTSNKFSKKTNIPVRLISYNNKYDTPAILKDDITISNSEETDNSPSGYLRVQLYISDSGKVDKINIIESTLGKNIEFEILNKILFAEYVPATHQGKPVPSILIGEFFEEK